MKKAFLATIPVMTGYIVLGFGFGIVLDAAGYGILPALAMSVFIYAGSMQYALVGLLTGGASVFTVALTTLMVNARHLFYGISMLGRYKDMGAQKPYLIFALTDETYSLVCTGEHEKSYYLTVSALNHCYWVAGTALGSVAGTLLNFNSTGIEFALTALFLTVFVEQWLSTKRHIPAIIGVAGTALCLVIFGSERFLIPAMLVIALSLCLWKERERDE